MLKLFSLLVVSFMLISSPVVFAESQNESTAKCKQWAQEEGIDKEDMDDYIAECVKTIAEEMEQDKK